MGPIQTRITDFFPGVHGTPAAAPEHPVETPASAPAARAPSPEGMPGGRPGGAAPHSVGGGRPRIPLAALQNRARKSLQESIESGLEAQAEMALLQAEASAKGFEISAAHQQVNSAVHMALTAVQTHVKGQNAQSDAAKDAI